MKKLYPLALKKVKSKVSDQSVTRKITDFSDPIGATIEIQRKMRMDEAEERFTRQQMEQIRIREQHIQRQIRRQQPPRQATPTPPCKTPFKMT